MPYRKGKRATKRAAKRKAARRGKRSLKYNKTSVSLGLGFPKRMVMTHKYAELIDIVSTAGVLGKHLFNCNGMFDPNSTGVGHQPLYYDQMAALYNHYTVIGSKIKLTVTPTATADELTYVGTWLDDDTTSTVIATVMDMAERSSGKIRQIAPNMNNSLVFYNNWSAKKTFGGSVLANDNLQGTISANPTENSFFAIGVGSGSAANTSVQVFVEITYTAVWEELKDISGS